MVRTLKVGRPTAKEIRWLSKHMMEWVNPCQRRRAEALTLYGMGLQPLEIARAQGVHPKTVYQDLHAFEQLGAEAIQLLRSRGPPVGSQPARSRRWCNWPNNLHKKWGRPMDASRCGS